jgi:hypothetical protein
VRPSARVSWPLPHARPGSGRAVRRKMTRERAPEPKQPDRGLYGRRASHARRRLARRGGSGVTDEPSPGAARRGVCGACLRSAWSRSACGRNASRRSAWSRSACGRNALRKPWSRSAWLRSPCEARASAQGVDLRQSAARSPELHVVHEKRALQCPHDGCCAGARGRVSRAERLESPPFRWPLGLPLHRHRWLRPRPGSTTLPSQPRPTRRPEYSAQRATEVARVCSRSGRGHQDEGI